MVDPLRHLVIVGGGTAGWIAAAMLARFVPKTTTIELIESDAIGTVGVGEATIPQIRLLTAGLGISEHDLLAQTQGTIKLGIEFIDWLRPGHRYMHAFGQVGFGHGVTPFHHHWLRGQALGIAGELGTYKISEVAAHAGKFATPPNAPASLSYAYHFDATLVAAYLRELAEGWGVRRTERRIVAVEHGENGNVSTLRLEGDRTVAGDFFLDCSGFRSLLLGDALGVGFEDWSHWLPCDRAMAVQSSAIGAPAPYTTSTAREAGWQWRIPLQHRTGNGYVYSSEHISDDEAAATLLANSDGEPLFDPRPLSFKAGKRKNFWERNVIALGLASGFMEPLESTSIHMVQSAVARLLSLFPSGGDNDAARDAYNRQTHFEYDRIRDFIILHYHATERDGALWQQCRDMDIPQELAEKLRQFRESGLILQEKDELFTEPGWLQIMVGQGISANSWSPLAQQLSDAELESFLSNIRRSIAEQVERLSSHAQYIAANFGAALSDRELAA